MPKAYCLNINVFLYSKPASSLEFLINSLRSLLLSDDNNRLVCVPD